MAGYITIRALATLALYASVLSAAEDSPPVIVASGYESPVHHRLAPGQVVTLFASGLPITDRVVARGVPLPTELSGVSVWLFQPQLTSPTLVPLLRLEPLTNGITAIVVQMPYEMIPGTYLAPITAGPGAIDTGELQVNSRDSEGARIRIIPVQDRIKLLRSCDSLPESLWEDPEARSRPCLPLVAHGNGTLVSAEQPAAAGETVVVYAFGLGRPPEPPVTGGPVPFPIAMPTDKWGVRFEFGLNAAPRAPSAHPDARPVYVGLVQGYTGLYQLNVRLPDRLPEALPGCRNNADSNMTISVWGAASNNSIGICMR